MMRALIVQQQRVLLSVFIVLQATMPSHAFLVAPRLLPKPSVSSSSRAVKLSGDLCLHRSFGSCRPTDLLGGGASTGRLVRADSRFVRAGRSFGSWRLRGGGARGPVMTAATDLHDPSVRESQYSGNLAQYLVDLHDSKAVFNFCGGMMFQLVLSNTLRNHLEAVAAGGDSAGQPIVFGREAGRMAHIPDYRKDAAADNVRLFHGREVRQVPNAAGGMGFVLHLSFAGGGDPEGWTMQEITGYDGWGHDSSRTWRDGPRLEQEGFAAFRSKFGASAFTLHHRFYLHLDHTNQIWLSAEDGCEGHPARARS